MVAHKRYFIKGMVGSDCDEHLLSELDRAQSSSEWLVYGPFLERTDLFLFTQTNVALIPNDVTGAYLTFPRTLFFKAPMHVHVHVRVHVSSGIHVHV